MIPYVAVAALLLVTSTLVVLPLAPGLRELHRKSDASALSVIQQHAGEIRYFADSFRTYIKTLEPALRECRASGRTVTGVMPDGTEYLALGSSDEALLRAVQPTNRQILIAAASDLTLPGENTFLGDIYAGGNVVGGPRSQYRAILAEKEVCLGDASIVMRWVHAVGEFSAASGCQLYGRISSDCSIVLQSGCAFSRLNAPRIQTGQGPASEPPSPRFSHVAAPLHTPQRLLHDGDLRIPAGGVVHGNLVVRGELHIGAGARVYGSVKSAEDMILDSDVSVEGSLISAKRLRVGPNSAIHGPIIAERKLVLASGTQCGRAESPTTVSAPRIEIAGGVVVFGSLWAREQGEVVIPC